MTDAEKNTLGDYKSRGCRVRTALRRSPQQMIAQQEPAAMLSPPGSVTTLLALYFIPSRLVQLQRRGIVINHVDVHTQDPAFPRYSRSAPDQVHCHPLHSMSCHAHNCCWQRGHPGNAGCAVQSSSGGNFRLSQSAIQAIRSACTYRKPDRDSNPASWGERAQSTHDDPRSKAQDICTGSERVSLFRMQRDISAGCVPSAVPLQPRRRWTDSRGYVQH